MDYEALGMTLALMVKEHLRAEMGALTNQVETLRKELDDLRSSTSQPITVPEVKDGDDGRGIEGAGIDDNGCLVLHYTDGTEQTLGRVVGKDASVDFEALAAKAAEHIQVPKPMSPPSVEQVAEVVLTSLKSDGEFLESLKGAPGIGIEVATVHEDGSLYLRMTDGSEVDVGCVVGEDGKAPTAEQVAQSLKSDEAFIKSLQGQDGASIVDAYIDEDKQLAVVLGTGQVKKLGRVVGKDGDNGDPGLGFDDLEIVQEGRQVSLVFTRGDETRKFGLLLNVPEYKQIWQPDVVYSKGDFVTLGGSLWHANKETAEKPGTSDDWTLAVKKGRDGRNS